MTRPLLSFVAIVKNEASNFRKTLESVKPFVDRYTVLDTGSTDGTQALVREVMGDLPGHLFEEPFVDFAATRNRALELDRTFITPTAFTLMLSGDETLHGGEALRAFLEKHRDAPDGAYAVMMQNDARMWPYTRVLRTGAGWKYVGKIHEMPIGPGGETMATVIPDVAVVHAPSDPERKVARLKNYDLPVLQKIVDDESYSYEERARAIFFLAETHTALAAEEAKAAGGEPDLRGPYLSHQYAAMALYTRFAQIAHQPDRPGYEPDKVGYALALYFNIAEVCEFFTTDEMISRLQRTIATYPRVPELRYMLAKHAAFSDIKLAPLLAEEAAKVAREARENPAYTITTDLRLEWISYRLAAACTMQLGRTAQAREYAKRGLEAGGPKEAFADFFGEVRS